MRNKIKPVIEEQKKESRPGIVYQYSGKIMKKIILTAMMMNVHIFSFGQQKAVVSINSK